jgi:hypothetical protein
VLDDTAGALLGNFLFMVKKHPVSNCSSTSYIASLVIVPSPICPLIQRHFHASLTYKSSLAHSPASNQSRDLPRQIIQRKSVVLTSEIPFLC